MGSSKSELFPKSNRSENQSTNNIDMLDRIFRILLVVLSITFIIMMAYAWIMKDQTSLEGGVTAVLRHRNRGNYELVLNIGKGKEIKMNNARFNLFESFDPGHRR